MREFAKSEVIREKCHWCGSKNKLHTELITSDSSVVGYSIRCCNCGRVDTFINPKLYSSIGIYHNGGLSTGRQKCIQESFCPHLQCPLYGTCGGHRKPPKEEVGFVDKNNNKLSNQTELMIKVKPEPKYKR